MRIAVVNNCFPFVWGGAEYLADSLRDKLAEAGHDAIIIRVPFRWDSPTKILESMLTARLLRFPNVDLVIALKFPAYCVDHPNKRVWLLHQFRQIYELWGTPMQGLPNSAESLAVREAIIRADSLWLGSVQKLYCNSPVTRERLLRYNGISAEVLYPPLSHPEQFGCEEYGDYVFFPGRMNAMKRQLLAVEAMKHTSTDVRLVLAGPADSPDDLRQIEQAVHKHGVSSRVAIIGRFISEQEKADLFSRALACVYIPFDEDSYGYVCLESYHSRKAVITCSDSGGILILVRDGETGLIAPPAPQALAEAFDRLYERRTEAQAMGEAGWRLVQSLDINWERVIHALVE